MIGIKRKNSIKSLSILLLAGLFSFSAFAYEPNDDKALKPATASAENQEEKKGFDAGKLIMEHIGDSYSWHLWGEGHNAVSIPLPVILYNDKGIDVFMSSAFHHGTEDVYGKYTYHLEENHIKIVTSTGEVNEEATGKIIDFSITKNVASLLIGAFIMLWMFLSVAKA